MHSHNYTPQQAYKRSFGEAWALAAVWDRHPVEMTRAARVLLGWASDARRDLVFCRRTRRLREWPRAARIRWEQRLVMRREYHWSVRERHARINTLESTEAMPWLAGVRRHHEAGVEFKLHPARSTAAREVLAAEHSGVTELARQVWLWIEQQRMCAPFDSPREYSESRHNKMRDSPRGRNVLVNLRALGIRPLLEHRATRHPRERIFNALALLLWERATLGSPDLVRFVQRELQTEAMSFPELIGAYRELWSKVN